MVPFMPHLETLDLLFGRRPFFEGIAQGKQISALQSALIVSTASAVVDSNRPLRVLEIGSWVGFSALTWAFAIHRFSPKSGKVVCVDMWESYFTHADLVSSPLCKAMDEWARKGLAYDLFIHNIGCAPPGVQMKHRRGLTNDVLPSFPDQSFDIVYIDGSHYYEQVKADIRQAKRIVRDGGVICGDDLNIQIGAVPLAIVQQHLEKDFVADPVVGPMHPGVTLAVSEEFGPVWSESPYWTVQRSGGQFVRFDPSQSPTMIVPHLSPQDQETLRERLSPRA